MRIVGWEKSLRETLERYRALPFAWGRADCLMFACDCAKAITGVDAAAQYRGTYDDAKGAARILRELGACDVATALATKFKSIPVARAARGDIAVVAPADPSDALGACGVFTGIGQLAVPGPNGIVIIPRSRATGAFEVC